MDTNNKLKLLQKWEKEHVKIDEAYDLIRKAFGSTPTLLLLVLCFQCLILIPKFCLYVCNLYIQDESRFCVGSIYLGGSRKPISFRGWDECDPIRTRMIYLQDFCIFVKVQHTYT